MKTILTAKSAGFCFGVSRSVKLAESLLASGEPVYCLGELIHNRDEVARLEGLGLRVVEGPEHVPEGGTVLVRSHGVGPDVIAALERCGAMIADATCPKVAHIHAIVRDAAKAGRQVWIIGDETHPEVRGVRGYAGKTRVFRDDEELSVFAESGQTGADTPLSVVFQTTQTKKVLENSKKILKKFYTNCEVFDTICNATQTRQAEAAALAARCGAVVVIGSRHSANSAHLAALCRERCANVLFVENAKGLDAAALAAFDTVGITAGASVPARIIKEVKQMMSDEIREEEQAEAVVTEENEAAVTGAEAPEAAEQPAVEAPAVPEGEKSFAELLEDSIKTIYNGDTVKGIVAAITPTEISVDLGTKQSGYIPVDDFSDDPNANIEDLVHVGDTVEACVVRVNDVEGTVMLSKRRLDSIRNWNDLEAAAEEGGVVEGKVTEENKGGVVVNVKGVRVFVPASQSGLPRDAAMTELVGKTVRLKITEVHKGRRRVVGSIRAVQARERRERAEKIWNEIEVGKRYDGVVKSLTSYGAFVDIGGVDGMVHVSELSWKRIGKPADVVTVGDEINVYVIGFDKEAKKISLGYKDPDANPWTLFRNTYDVGSVASVRVVKLMTFGAFAEVVPGVDGLIHISQIANRRIGKPDEVLAVGDTVEAKITAIDEENHKVSLSIRALSEPEPAPARRAPEREVEEEPAPAAAEDDALVFEVSETGQITGIVPEEDEAAGEE